MPRRSASSNAAKNLPFKEITSKLGSDELIKRLKVLMINMSLLFQLTLNYRDVLNI